MQPWFIWKNKNSYTEGLWISKLPSIIRADERNEEIVIPGRPGSLIMLEGEDIYDSYVKECVVQLPNTRNVETLLAWLCGSGDVVFSNEPEKAYEAIITSKVEFQRIGNTLLQATIPFFVKPYKKSRYGDDAITITTSGTIRNLGNVASKPIVTVTGGTSVEIAGVEMTFGGSGTLVVDCENHIVTQNGDIFTGSVTGEFWTIPKGESEVTGDCVIQPRWRWV